MQFPMLDLQLWPDSDARRIEGIFTDIDDTLTSHGEIAPEALQALADLKAAGLIVIPITGRHTGWCQPLLESGSHGKQPWPVDAIVAENGAVAFVPQPAPRQHNKLSKIYQQDASTRAKNHRRMQVVAQRVMREVPTMGLARDLGGRETDIAFDFNEHVHLPPDTVRQVLSILHDEGMFTAVSSIHIHGCFENFNKWRGARWIAQELFGRDLSQELDRWVFVGDSGNDQAMFQHFIHSMGVSNIRRVAATLSYLPRYITPSAGGAGFAEVAQRILNARAALTS